MAAAEILATFLHETSVTRRVFLDSNDFEALRLHGLARIDVEQAIEDLARAGRIAVVCLKRDVLLELPIGVRP